MFLKNRKRLPWICCMIAAFFLSFRLAVLDENNQGDKSDDVAVTTTFFYSKTESSVSATLHYLMAEGEESVPNVDIEERESGVVYRESGGRRMNLSSVLLVFGLFFAVLFIFFLKQEHSYFGPEAEVFVFFICVLRIRQPIDTTKFFYMVYLWVLFCFLLVSVRCLWTWIRKGFPIEWSTGHRLGKMAVGNSGKQSRYLTVQFVFCILALIAGIGLFLSVQGDFYFFPWISIPIAGCLMAVILSVSGFMKLAYDMDHLSEQIEHLHQGNPVSLRLGAFADEEEKLIDLNRQREEAVHTAVTSERFKVDLISNVSHDLRTPLTAILGYGELLKGEKLSLEGTKQLEELNRKAGYMRDLVDSLFELTKVSSGVAECKKEQIDLIRLLEQTIGLFDDQLSESNLCVRRHYEADHLLLVTDGFRMHQVFANLVGNAIKYSLKGTRIHLEVKECEEEYRIRMTNTASYEMDFDSTEILKRFVRGDKARTTRGSGLGLAIAQTYTESVGGKFEVTIDGDQFNAIVGLPKN